jgi:hypothetical protein
MSSSKGQMSVTALQDWLSISPVTSKTVRSLVPGPLRSLLAGKWQDNRCDDPPLLRPGLERC